MVSKHHVAFALVSACIILLRINILLFTETVVWHHHLRRRNTSILHVTRIELPNRSLERYYNHQLRVLEHMQSRRLWENQNLPACTMMIDRPVRKSHCAWNEMETDDNFCPIRCNRKNLACPDVRISESMENDGTCVHGDEHHVCISVDSDADVHAQYFSWEVVDFMTQKHPHVSERSEGFLASFVSNCAQWRVDYLAMLSAALTLGNHTVHHYGSCLRNADEGHDVHGKYATKNLLGQHHRFVFAFENSERNGYVTEKLFYMLSCGAIPVYRGAPNVRQYLPTPHAAIIVEPDEPPEALAQRLIQETDVQYSKRLAWRLGQPDLAWVTRMDLGVWHSRCRLCVRLASMEQPPKTSGLWVRERGWLEYTMIKVDIETCDFVQFCIAVVLALADNDKSMKPEGGKAVAELYMAWDRHKCPITSMDEIKKLQPGTELEAVLENPGWKRRASFAQYKSSIAKIDFNNTKN